MQASTLRWKKDNLELLDQRQLPQKTKYVKCSTEKDVYRAIRTLIVRGAPAIGVAAAYGAYLGVRASRAKNYSRFKKELEREVKYLAGARPTARNLFWALERIQIAAEKNKKKSVTEIKKIILREAQKIHDEDVRICRDIGLNGKKLIPNKARILTHCNAGGLATAGCGTALSVVYASGRKVKMVYADETRPVLQGARLTVWELTKSGVPTTLICDNTAASLISKGEIDLIIVGADRIAVNGDIANKIGTYNLAVLADYHKIPFYVAAPVSTFDLSISNGGKIPIEERPADEVRKIGGRYITVKNVKVKNYAFDVTPAKLITAIITERGVIRRPNKKKVSNIVK